jgi:hypothetical protein
MRKASVSSVNIDLKNLSIGKDIFECIEEDMLTIEELSYTEKAYYWFYLLSRNAHLN